MCPERAHVGGQRLAHEALEGSAQLAMDVELVLTQRVSCFVAPTACGALETLGLCNTPTRD